VFVNRPRGIQGAKLDPPPPFHQSKRPLLPINRAPFFRPSHHLACHASPHLTSPSSHRASQVVVASKYLFHAVAVQRWLSSLSFRVYASQDTVGVELGGALKNPLAVGAGMIEGMGLGINTMAA